MILKPGWIIALMMLWVVIQVLITVGDTSLSMSDLDQAPIIQIITTAQKMDTLSGAINYDNWGTILSSTWDIFTFQANFLTGSWTYVSLLLTCIYAGLGVSLLYTFVTKVL